ncbi:MAG: HdeA/HdeB family chaperone [Gammaproteobacteria bacterium]|nr:HdeA/HdeB family chaperone [Gammaproteobacteria bacterium]
MLSLLRLTILLFTLMTGSVIAADSMGNYQVMGLGKSSCKAFIASDAEGKAFFYSWLAGYMTAYNRIENDTYSILGRSKKLANLEGWLQDYCHLNPTLDFSNAIHKLLIKLNYTRVKRKPSEFLVK